MTSPMADCIVTQIPLFTRDHACQARGAAGPRCGRPVEYVMTLREDTPFAACRWHAWMLLPAADDCEGWLGEIWPIDEYRTDKPVWVTGAGHA